MAGKTITLTPSGGSRVVTTVVGDDQQCGRGHLLRHRYNGRSRDVHRHRYHGWRDDRWRHRGRVSRSATRRTPTGGGRHRHEHQRPQCTGRRIDGRDRSRSLSDANGDVVTGKTVTLTAQGGHSVVSPASAVTDQNGDVTFTVTDTPPRP